MGKRREISLGFTSERCLEGLHVCYIFQDERERRATVARYLQAGIEAGERVIYLADRPTMDEVLEQLTPHGLRPPVDGRSLSVQDALATYRPEGASSAPMLLGSIGPAYRAARAEGFVGMRAAAEMTGMLTLGADYRGELLAYEALLTDTLKRVPMTACCQYDASRLDGNTLMDVLGVHPLMIVRGQLVHNPYYVEPDQFFAELRDRHRTEPPAS